jgi:uncharacterized SAM-binding protein YcdF (DUF218 family)
MRSIFYSILAIFLVWFGGYMWYVQKLSQNQIDLSQKSDAIVVLTGGKNRLSVAGDLLEEKVADKLYISGVDEKVTREELNTLIEVNQELADCCVESGKQAADTVGNAIETLEWVSKNNIKSIRVVTSLEHMPRAMVEFNRFMPDIEFIEHPVGSWRPENINYFNLSQEYSKYIISMLRARISTELYTDAS